MTVHGSRRFSRPRSLVAFLALGVTITLSACATLTPPFGRVESVVVGDRYETTPQQADVRIVRSDGVVTPTVSTRLAKGDSIVTSSRTRIVIQFAAGYRVTLDTGTAIFIENPSLFLRIGRAFVERLRGARDTLTTKTNVVVLHDAGTRFLVSVSAPTVTTLTVVDGLVRAESPERAWPPVTYGPLQQAEVVAGTPPRRGRQLRPDELERELRWVRAVERVSRIPVPRLDSQTESSARATLERAGLRVLLVRRSETGRAAPGLVVGQEPSAGDSVPPGTFVNLVLESESRPARVDSTRREPESRCTVPKITQIPRDEAERMIVRAGLRGEGTRDQGELSIVTSQREQPGARVPCGSVVRYRYGVVG